MGLSWVWSDSPYQSALAFMVGLQGELTSGRVWHFLVGMPGLPGCTLPLPCTIKWGIPWCKSHTQGGLYTLSKTPFLTITSPPPLPTRDPPDPTRIVCQCETHLPAKFQHRTLKARVTIHQHLSSLLLKTPTLHTARATEI